MYKEKIFGYPKMHSVSATLLELSLSSFSDACL